MANAATRPFETLKVDPRFSGSPSLSHERRVSNHYGDGGRRGDGSLDDRAASPKGPDPAWEEEQHPTPPISVPYPDDRHREEEEEAIDDIEYSLHPRYAQPSPFEQFARHRHPSISFSPEVTLESGGHRPLNEPLEHSTRRGSGSDTTSPRGSVRLQDFYGSPSAEQVAPNEGAQSESGSYNNGRKTYPVTSAHYPFISPSSDPVPIDTDLPRAISLTSLSTASPVTEELRTPPENRRDIFATVLNSSPSFQHAASFDGGDGWLSMRSGSKPKGYLAGRIGTLRQPRRQSSRRSTNSSGKSPASAFLSMWNRDDVVPQPDDEGQVVGSDYVLGKQIGFGGFSTVKEAFKVKDDGDTDVFAVKIVKKHLPGKSERENDQVQAEFDHEVRVWRYLNHPHVLSLDSVYETDYATFCFTRLTTGGTLFDLIRKHRQGLKLHQAKHYAYQLASSVRYLHEDARVVHRDIKLENCLLESDCSPSSGRLPDLFLCDFGMAEWMATDSGGNVPYDDATDRLPPKNIGPSDTSTSVAGSLEYASPELLLSTHGVLDPVADVWALGVVIYALVVGSRPFQHPFQPRVQMNILSGKWDKTAVVKGDDNVQERHEALDLIQGCLEMDTAKRWTIADIMNCAWFRGCADDADEPANHSQWRY